MRHSIHALLLVPFITAGCGMSDEEHQRALDQQKATFDAEMKKMQDAHGAETSEKGEILASKDQMIGGLEGEVKKLGGDLDKVRGELGDRVTQLASAKSELAATTAEVEQLRKLREEAERDASQFKEIANRLKSMIDAGQLEVVMRKGRINLKLPDEILFPSGSQALKKGGRDALTEVAAVLKEVDRDYLIAGHTDNVPVGRSGKFKTNWELSTARAVAVVQLMIKEGVAPERLAAAGFGEFDPVADNETKEGRQKNRRLEIVLIPKIDKISM